MDRIVLSEGKWWGWQEVPVRNGHWSVSPIFVTAIRPQKKGRNMLHIRFIHALHPLGAVRRAIDLRVSIRMPTHLVGTFVAEDAALRTAIVSGCDFGWLRNYCQLLGERRWPGDLNSHVEGSVSADADPEAYLAKTLGRDESEALAGASVLSVDGEKPPMPSRVTHVRIDSTYDPFDSWLIARGFVPSGMDDRWFIYLEKDRLYFRRSWTGLLIYDVEVQWQGARLILGTALVNREPSQYSETNDEHDQVQLVYLIDSILRGVPAEVPNLH
jgi:hypothetical protein